MWSGKIVWMFCKAGICSYLIGQRIINSVLTSQDRSQLINDTRSGAKFFYCKNAFKCKRLTTSNSEGKAQTLLGNVFVYKKCKTKV